MAQDFRRALAILRAYAPERGNERFVPAAALRAAQELAADRRLSARDRSMARAFLRRWQSSGESGRGGHVHEEW